jgi:hypothetical protein
MRLGKNIAAILVLLFASSFSFATACPSGYTYSKVFLAAKQPSTRTSFPVLIPFNGASASGSFTLDDMKVTGSGGKILSSGNDIVFCDAYSGGNLLNFERINYVTTTGQVEFWVSRTLSSSAPTPIWMFYGKASDSDHSSAAAVWSAYGMVIHAPDGSSLTLTDSTGTNTITNAGATAASGQIDGALTVSGTGPKSANVADNASIKPTTGLTYSAWVYPTANVSVGMILTKNNGSDASGYDLYLGSGGSSTQPTCQVPVSGSYGIVRASASIPLNTWSYVVCTLTSNPNSSANFKLYVNGVEVTSLASASYSTTSIATNTTAFGIGRRQSGTAFNGEARIDEIRVDGAMHTADQIAAEFQNQSSPNGFVLMVDSASPAGMTSGAYCIPLTIDHTKIPNTDQSDFPLLVRGVYPWMADTSNGGFAVVGNSCHDIRFYSDSACTSTLDFLRVFCTNTSGDFAARVRVPTASHTVDTVIYVKIGGTGDTSDLSTSWMGSYSYVGVYPLGSPTSLDTADYGSAGLDLNNSQAGSPAPCISPVGGCVQIPNDATTVIGWVPTGTDSIGAHGYPTGTVAFHMRGLVRFNAVSAFSTSGTGICDDCSPFSFGKANGTGMAGLSREYRPGVPSILYGFTTGSFGSGSPSKSLQGNVSSPNFVADTAWHWIDIDRAANGDNINAMSMYFDGQLVTTPFVVTGTNVPNIDNANGVSGGPAEIRIGRDAGHGAAWFTGEVAQWETHSVTRSADYVASRYKNESSTSYSFGTASAIAPPAGSFKQLIPGIITRLNDLNQTIDEATSRAVAGTYIRKSMTGNAKNGATDHFSTVVRPRLVSAARGIRKSEASWTWKWKAQRLPTMIADPKTMSTSRFFLQSSTREMTKNTETVIAGANPQKFPRKENIPWRDNIFVGASTISAADVRASRFATHDGPKNAAMDR